LQPLVHIYGTGCHHIYASVIVLGNLNGCSRLICFVLETAALCNISVRSAVYKSSYLLTSPRAAGGLRGVGDQCVCLSVRLNRADVQTSPNFLRCCPRPWLVLLWRRCNALCTSGFVDDVAFARIRSGKDNADRAYTQSDSPGVSTDLIRPRTYGVALFASTAPQRTSAFCATRSAPGGGAKSDANDYLCLRLYGSKTQRHVFITSLTRTAGSERAVPQKFIE